jgi:hypothetical protein
MRTTFGRILLAVSCLFFVTATGLEADDAPIEVKHFRQLFVDDYVIDELSDVQLTLHQPTKHPQNPVLRHDKPWEAKSVALYGTVLYDREEQIFKMWYRAIDDTVYACYAKSRDGFRWTKPTLNVMPHKGSRANNIVLGGLNPKFYLDGFAVVKDARDSDPHRRYKMLTYNGHRRYACMVSSDGIRWRGPINAKEHDTGDVVSMYYDTGLGQYVGLLKRRALVNGTKRRARLVNFSDDFSKWSQPRWALVPDDEDPDDTHFYSHVAFMYEDLRIGYLTVFNKDTELIDTRLCFSRDGIQWQRYRQRSPFLPTGREGIFDSGMLLADASGLIERDGKIWIYYSGYNTDHEGKLRGDGPAAGHIGLAHLRQDGFVSADGGPQGGSLLTKPLVCSGPSLRVNAVANEGEVRAELLDVNGRPIAGRDLAASESFSGNALDVRLCWKGDSDQSYVGTPVRIRFHLKNAELYSFRFAAE